MPPHTPPPAQAAHSLIGQEDAEVPLQAKKLGQVHGRWQVPWSVYKLGMGQEGMGLEQGVGDRAAPASQGLVPCRPGTAETTALWLQPTPASISSHSWALNPGRDSLQESLGGWPARSSAEDLGQHLSSLAQCSGEPGSPVPSLSVRKQRGSCLGAIPRGPCLGPGQPPRDSLALCSYSLFTGEFPPLFLAVSIILPVPFTLWPPLAPNFLLNLQLYPCLSPCPSGPEG